jgi:hypothetical protein
MIRREAWEHFALLNPFLKDDRAGVQMPQYHEALDAHLKAGGHIVPMEVPFARDGSLLSRTPDRPAKVANAACFRTS